MFFFNSFKADIANGVHNLGFNNIKIALTNVQPLKTNKFFTDIVEISQSGGYITGGKKIDVVSSTQVNGVYSLYVGNYVKWNSTGNFPLFRYAVVYDDTLANGNLILCYDNLTTVNLLNDMAFTVNVPTSFFTLI